MPDTVFVSVEVVPEAKARLFNDGQDRFSLTVRSEQDLLRPSQSGKFHIYGLCHEVAHLAMYRPIQNRRWMTNAAAEGWAHYLGSQLVDVVYEKLGENLWPDPYDYRRDGMSRLENQLRSHTLQSETTRPTTIGAGLWRDLAQQLGHRKVAEIFRKWGEVDYQSPDATTQMKRHLLAVTSGDLTVQRWWQLANSLFIAKFSHSRFAEQTMDADQIQNETELSHDDGKSSGKKSIAGSGHAVLFTVDNDSSYLTSVRIKGSRYGTPRAPQEDFSVWLCDQEFNEIKEFKFPYSKFARGTEKWVKLKVEPTKVPQTFYVCVGFNPTGTKGVFVSRDAKTSGNSFSGLPGRAPRKFADGDWMFRATVGMVSKLRSWSDVSGKFTVQAEFVELKDGKVRLKKQDGSKLAVELDRLSKRDRDYLDSIKAGGPSSRPVVETSGTSIVLKNDDGKPAGKKSFPQGFAVAFSAGERDSLLTGIQIHGSRYGTRQAPDEEFVVGLCDKNFQTIKQFKFPYSKFERGDPSWISLPVDATELPEEFVICVDFKAARNKGVFVSHDQEGSGLMGTPGKKAGVFRGGDWLIRAEISKTK